MPGMTDDVEGLMTPMAAWSILIAVVVVGFLIWRSRR